MATLGQIKAWLNDPASGSQVYRRNWDQKCQALMWQLCAKFGTAPTVYTSANSARTASTIVSTNAAAAPPGAFHYWTIGEFGHVGISLGNGYALMGTTKITDKWATNVGVNSVSGYTASTGAVYKGWSSTNGRNDVVIDGVYGTAPASVGGGTVDYAFGLNSAAQLASQKALNKLGLYSGVQDGVFGGLSVRALQQHLKNTGLLPAAYVVDGVPGKVYGSAVQELAKRHGYSGPIDGAPGAATSAGIIAWAATVLAAAPVTPPPVVVEPPVVVPVTTAFGIDVATPQKGIDFAKAKAEGAQFVVVKMGGLNVLPQYVAPQYKIQVDGAKAQGLKVGHYYLIGSGQTPKQQADYFVDNLYNFDVTSDILALDNEKLDSNGTNWSDADVHTFFARVIQRTGIPASRLWHYASASDYRNHKPWSQTEALGVQVWWAAYGAYPTGQKPDHTPDLQGAVADWAVHQYSSKVAVAGFALDGNFSKHTVEELFATGTVTEPVPDPIIPDPDPVDTELVDSLKALNVAISRVITALEKTE
jgi:GH25 family lysozyme M1 (1,4-beta-N-acetylmuramidase)